MNAKYSVPSLAALSAALLVTAAFGAVAPPKPMANKIIRPVAIKPVKLRHHTIDRPVVQGTMIVYPDGASLRGSDHYGHPAHILPDGTVVYPDGIRATHDPRTGLIYVEKPDGVETVAGSGVPAQSNGTITFPDGFTVHAKGPDANLATINPDGSVTFPDGTSMTHNSNNGDTNFFSPGGKVTYDNWRTGQHSAPKGEFVKEQPEASAEASQSESSSETSEAPERDPPEKPDPVDEHGGMIVNNDGPGGNGVTHKPGEGSFHLSVAGTNDAPAKPNGEAPSTPPKAPARSFGPGGRPFSESNTHNGAGNSVLRGVNIVVDPDPNALTGGAHKPVVIDPEIGHVG